MNALDRTFRIRLFLKVLDGVRELIGSVLLLVVSASQITSVVRLIAQQELLEEPTDTIATQLRGAEGSLPAGATLLGAIYLLLHP